MEIRQLAIYPVKGEPGRMLERAEVEGEGFAGDRRKRQPVHLVGADETPETTRANVFVDAAPEAVVALVGSRVRLGSATLLVTQLPSGCAGVYAQVIDPGEVRVGDTIEVRDT